MPDLLPTKIDERKILDVNKEQEQQLLDYSKELSDTDMHTLLRFAAFLAQAESPAPAIAHQQIKLDVATPGTIPRPAQERVVDAIKRLAETYPMLDKKKLLGQTAGMVAEHVMGNKPAREVIDDLEASFRRAYELWIQAQGKDAC